VQCGERIGGVSGQERGRVREREEIEVKKERGNEGRRGERGQ
jgi:hypothetical protein